MEDIEIKKALENVEVKPSARCWQAIESGLPAAATSATAIATKKGILHLTSISAKIIVGCATAAIVAAAVTILILTKPQQSSPIPQTSSVAIVDTSATIADINEEHYTNVAAIERTTSQETNVSQPSAATNIASVIDATPAESETTTSKTPTIVTQNITKSQPTSTVSKAEQISSPITDNSTNNQANSPASPQRIVKNDPVLTEQIHSNETKPISITIPNVFTPNGDGFNDQFIILGIEDCEQHRLIIKNRTGKIVFQSTDYHNDWTAEGLPEGTYLFQFAYKIDGIEEVRSGSLTILR